MSVGWGIIGIGKVADIAAPAIDADDQSTLAAVCSRSLDRAKAFAESTMLPRVTTTTPRCWTTRP